MRVRNARCILGMLLFVALNVAAQNSLAASVTVSGVVVDPTGATVPRARVMLLDLKTFKTQTVSVGGDGKFLFTDLIPGDFGLIVAGSDDPYAGCWKPVLRQVETRKVPTQNLRITLSLDNERCPGIVD